MTTKEKNNVRAISLYKYPGTGESLSVTAFERALLFISVSYFPLGVLIERFFHHSIGSITVYDPRVAESQKKEDI